MTAWPTYKGGVAAAFGKAVAGYDTAARVQRHTAERLAARIAGSMPPSEPRVLEVGCGTGLLTKALGARITAKDWVLTDLSEPMVRHHRARFYGLSNASFLVMDGEAPCFERGRNTFDLICSSLVFQWFENLERSLANLAGLLAPGGRLCFATLASGSFAEWTDAVAAHGSRSGIGTYPDLVDLRRAMPEGGVSSVDKETLLVTYPSAAAFLSELKQIGAGLPCQNYKPLSPGALRSILRAHETEMPITYRLAFGSFWLDT